MTRHRPTSLETIRYYLSLVCRMALFFLALLFFAGMGLLDAGLRFLWPAWRSRESAPRWTSSWLPRVVTKIFPSILLIPCSWHRQHRVLHFSYPRHLCPSERGWVKLAIQNVGGEAWRGGGANPLRIGVLSPPARSAFYVADEWSSSTRPAELRTEDEIQPSMTASFKIPIQAPSTPGLYREAWGPLIEGRNWLPALSPLNLKIEVTQEI